MSSRNRCTARRALGQDAEALAWSRCSGCSWRAVPVQGGCVLEEESLSPRVPRSADGQGVPSEWTFQIRTLSLFFLHRDLR